MYLLNSEIKQSFLYSLETLIPKAFILRKPDVTIVSNKKVYKITLLKPSITKAKSFDNVFVTTILSYNVTAKNITSFYTK